MCYSKTKLFHLSISHIAISSICFNVEFSASTPTIPQVAPFSFGNNLNHNLL